MAEEVRKRTDLEEVHDEVFDPKHGLLVRMDAVEEDWKWLASVRANWKTIRWALVPIVLTLLSQVGSWLADLLRGGM